MNVSSNLLNVLQRKHYIRTHYIRTLAPAQTKITKFKLLQHEEPLGTVVSGSDSYFWGSLWFGLLLRTHRWRMSACSEPSMPQWSDYLRAPLEEGC